MRSNRPISSLIVASIGVIAIMNIDCANCFVIPSNNGLKPHSFVRPKSHVISPPKVCTTVLPQAAALTTSTSLNLIPTEGIDALSSLTLGFSDQGQNLAGIFFQASLLPYLLFLYFLQYKPNSVPNLGNFGFQYLLLFVLSTIPSGIISKSQYSETLANVDWLHGGAEGLLTMTSLLVVAGFRSASVQGGMKGVQGNEGLVKGIAVSAAVLFGACAALGPQYFEAHTAFLGGVGNLPEGVLPSLSSLHPEPSNALSIPTWAIHFSSVFEWLFAMKVIWDFSEVTGNEKWKGMTWGMLPLHASGVCACTYHFFYNDKTLQFLVSTQAGLTLLGNITCMIAAYRIAVSNGWSFGELNPLPQPKGSGLPDVPDSAGIQSIEGYAASTMALTPYEAKESELQLVGKLGLATLTTAYLVKYGELFFDLPFTANGVAGTGIILAIPALVAAGYYGKSEDLQEKVGFKFGGDSGEGGKTLEFADVKKYGVAGTVAYVITELAFWIVAFPVAATALYNTSGHWPDFGDNADRAAVLGFIFAGANVARLAVPLRLGAALALAPWVDENLLNRGEGGGGEGDETIRDGVLREMDGDDL
ncbi:hypothetical protein TrVE_jg706 [Triparma verrucosa]|uniref:Uncharacterized protein n=1 Tax=Triparma verrucosa TaxID=1606542 RepID=A0A9W7EXX4_9STRA|nr:hypothetical protein TrVE_jg706 [Triparma verrucosa]